MPITVWKPEIISHDVDPAVSSDPPAGDGRIAYVSLAFDPNTPCQTDDKGLITVSRPYDLKHPHDGGVLVNFRGNASTKNGRCVLQGFYMNEPLLGLHQGWVETYFGAVDEKRLIASGTYCLAEQNPHGHDSGK